MPNFDLDETTVGIPSQPHTSGSSKYHEPEVQGNLNAAMESVPPIGDNLLQEKNGFSRIEGSYSQQNGGRRGGLNIGIVGAGIAGLGAAIALRKEGHDIEIFERSKFASETGAAIVIGPNATRILSRWGFDFQKSQAVIARNTRVFKADTLDTELELNCGDPVVEFGAEWYFLHRVDLHSELLRLAMAEGDEETGRVNVRLGAEVIAQGTDVEKAKIMLKSGEIVKKDLIIAADGVHSIFVTKITNSSNPATPSGFSAFRFLIPTSDLLSDPLTSQFFSGPSRSGNLQVAKHKDNRRLVFYPCRGSTIQNFAGIHPVVVPSSSSPPPHNHTRLAENWHLPSRPNPTTQDVNLLAAAFPNVHPSVKAIFSKAKDIKLWPLLHRSALQTWHRGRCVVIGDAAHPMLPHQGQAGAMALEDAAGLGVVFSRAIEGLGYMKQDNGDYDEAEKQQEREIIKRLQAFEKVRMHRATGMQVFSSVGQDEADEKIPQEVMWKYFHGPPSSVGLQGRPPSDKNEEGNRNRRKLKLDSKEFEVWKFGHDVVEESWRVLREEGYEYGNVRR